MGRWSLFAYAFISVSSSTQCLVGCFPRGVGVCLCCELSICNAFATSCGCLWRGLCLLSGGGCGSQVFEVLRWIFWEVLRLFHLLWVFGDEVRVGIGGEQSYPVEDVRSLSSCGSCFASDSVGCEATSVGQPSKMVRVSSALGLSRDVPFLDVHVTCIWLNHWEEAKN